MRRTRDFVIVPAQDRNVVERDPTSILAEALEISREEVERIDSTATSALFCISNVDECSMRRAAYNLILGDAKTKRISPLKCAVQWGWVSVVRQLLEENTDTTQLNGLLHIAATNGYLKVVGLLLDYGADINERDDEFCTPLMLAIQGKEMAVVKLLLDRRADVNNANRRGWTPLMLACIGGSNIRALEDGLGQGQSRIPASRQILASRLSEGDRLKAAFCGEDDDDMKMIDWLIEAGADVGRSGYMGVTASQLAFQFGKKRTMQKLMEAGLLKEATTRTMQEQGVDPKARGLIEGLAKAMLEGMMQSNQSSWTGLTEQDKVRLFLKAFLTTATTISSHNGVQETEQTKGTQLSHQEPQQQPSISVSESSSTTFHRSSIDGSDTLDVSNAPIFRAHEGKKIKETQLATAASSRQHGREQLSGCQEPQRRASIAVSESSSTTFYRSSTDGSDTPKKKCCTII